MTRRTLTIVVCLAVLALLGGCTGKIPPATLTPRLTPPDIGSAGVLRVSVDLGYPPFAGTAKGEKVGLDIDVAAALADQLGLKLELVDAKPSAAAPLAREGKVDLVMGALTVEEAVALQLAYAGTYVTDSSAVFAAKVETLTIGDLSSSRVAVQMGSVAYWYLLDTYGEGPLVVTPTLSEAMKAAAAGEVDAAAGDAIVMAYAGRTIPGLKYGGQLAPAFPLGMGVAQDKTKLESEVRSALDKLSSQGVLEALRRKWARDLPRFAVQGGLSDEATATPETTTTP